MALHELDPRDQGDPFFPHHWLKEVMMVYIVLGILLTLCILIPFALHEQADPMSTPAGIKPEWYFLAPYQILKYIPKVAGIIGMGIGNVVFILWPFMDREFRGKRLSTGTFHMALVVGLMGFLMFSALGRLSETTIKVGKTAYHIDLKGIPHKVQPPHPNPLPQGERGSRESPPFDGRGALHLPSLAPSYLPQQVGERRGINTGRGSLTLPSLDGRGRGEGELRK